MATAHCKNFDRKNSCDFLPIFVKTSIDFELKACFTLTKETAMRLSIYLTLFSGIEFGKQGYTTSFDFERAQSPQQGEP